MLSKEERAQLEQRLSYPWGRVELQCDEYKVTLCVQPKSPLRYEVVAYVNGEIRGVWTDERQPAPEQKFLRKITKPLVSPAERQRAEKLFGKRRVAKEPLYSGTYTYFVPYWPSAKAAISHLCKVTGTIAVITGLSSADNTMSLGDYFAPAG